MSSHKSRDELLFERDAAEFLRVSVFQLQRWRWKGEGPDYVRVGGPSGRAIRYTGSALNSWIEANTIRNGAAGQ